VSSWFRSIAISIAAGAAGALIAAPALAAQSPGDADLSGTWEITQTYAGCEVNPETAISADDECSVDDSQKGPFTSEMTFACMGDVCIADPGWSGIAELSAVGGSWEGEYAEDGFGRSVELTRQGSALTGTVRTVAPTATFIYDLSGTFIRAAASPSPTATISPTPPDASPTPAPTVAPTTEVLALTERQVASIRAVSRHDRSSVAAALVTPGEAFSDAGRIAQNALLAGLLMLLIVFPSQLFNSTWDQHHDRIVAAFRRRRPDRGRSAATDAHASDRPRRSQLPMFVAVAAGGAVLAGFLDPAFGLDAASIALVLGVLVSILVGVVVAGVAGAAYRRARDLPAASRVRAVPAGLLIAAVCVIVSRLTDFRPGYLYGLLGGVAFAATLERRDEGRAEWAVLGAGLVVALAAWIGFGPVSNAANATDPGFGVQALDALLAALFIGGIEGLLFSLIPIRFLPGHRIATWSRTAWAVSAAIAAFTFVHVLLRPASGYLGTSSTASVAVTFGLFAAFAVASVLFWGWFRLRPTEPGTSEAGNTARTP